MHEHAHQYYMYSLAFALDQIYKNIIIMSHYLSQYFPAQSPHASAAILFCDIVIVDIMYIQNSFVLHIGQWDIKCMTHSVWGIKVP